MSVDFMNKVIAKLMVFLLLLVGCGPSGGDDDDDSSASPAPQVYRCTPTSVGDADTMIDGILYIEGWSDQEGAWVHKDEVDVSTKVSVTTYHYDDIYEVLNILIDDCWSEQERAYECTDLPSCDEENDEYRIQMSLWSDSSSEFEGEYTIDPDARYSDRPP